MAWQIDFEGEVYREVELTLGLAEQIDAKADSRWGGILTNPGATPGHFAVTVAVLHSDRTGEPYQAVLERVRAFTWDQFQAAYKLDAEPDDLPVEYTDGFPPEADEPSTAT